MLATRPDTFSAAVAAYAIPREWGANVEFTLVTWQEEELHVRTDPLKILVAGCSFLWYRTGMR